jgi:hypothetical protein
MSFVCLLIICCRMSESVIAGKAPEAVKSRDELAKEKLRAEQLHDRCERAVDIALGGDHYVRHLVEDMNSRGCPVRRSFLLLFF